MRASVLPFCAALALSGPAAAAVKCQTQAERESTVRILIGEIDWFLSVVEEVPEAVAQQFRDVDSKNERAFRNAIAHPLWRAHEVRETADNVKRSLTIVRSWEEGSRAFFFRAKAAVRALQSSADFVAALREYGYANPGRRIVDFEGWTIRYRLLPLFLGDLAICLVDPSP